MSENHGVDRLYTPGWKVPRRVLSECLAYVHDHIEPFAIHSLSNHHARVSSSVLPPFGYFGVHC